MQMTRVAALAAVLVAAACQGEVIYTLDNVRDSVNGQEITWIKAQKGSILVGTEAGRMAYSNGPDYVAMLAGDSYVLRAHPNWIGGAYSNLDMGNQTITNATGVYGKYMVFTTHTGNTILPNQDGVSLGVNWGNGVRQEFAAAYAPLFLGENHGLQYATYGCGAIFGGLNRDRQDAGADCVINLVKSSGAVYPNVGKNWQVGNADLAINIGYLGGNCTQLVTSTDNYSDSGKSCLNYGFMDTYFGLQIHTQAAKCSWNVGGWNVNSNAYSYVFGTGMVSHTGSEIVAPRIWLANAPTLGEHAVPLWYVTNLMTTTSNGIAAWFGGLAATIPTDMRNGVRNDRYVTPSNLLVVVNATNSGANAGGILKMYAGKGASATGGSVMVYGGTGPSANGGSVDTHGETAAGGGISTYGTTAAGGSIDTHGGTYGGGRIDTSDGGGAISTKGAGTNEMGDLGTRTTLKGTATSNLWLNLPNENGMLATRYWVGTQAADLKETRWGTNNNVYVSPVGLNAILCATNTSTGSGGSINLSADTANGGSISAQGSHSFAATGGSISMNGGGDIAAAAGSITTDGGAGDGHSVGGSISTYGGAGTSANGGGLSTYGGASSSAAGGSISTYGGTLPGGAIITYDGGGAIDTRTGYIELGLTASRTKVKSQAAGTFALPKTISANGCTAMTTVANISLDMAANQIVNCPWANDPTNVPCLAQVMGMTNALGTNLMAYASAHLFTAASASEVRAGTLTTKGITPYSLQNGSDNILVSHNGLSATYGGHTAAGGPGGTLSVAGGAGGSGYTDDGRGALHHQYGGSAGALSLAGGNGGINTDPGNIPSGAGGDGGSGGVITMVGGNGGNITAQSLGGYGGSAGIVCLNGGAGMADVGLQTTLHGGNAGTLNLSGGSQSSAGENGGSGGSVISMGSNSYSGGTITMSASPTTRGGNIYTANGGGDIDTLAGFVVLGTGSVSTMVKAQQCTSLSNVFVLPSNNSALLSSTAMTTVASVDLDMYGHRVANVTTANADNAVAPWSQITNLVYLASLAATPIGTIQAFGGGNDKVPAGWLLCNGKEISRSGKYLALFTAIGLRYGYQAGDTFSLPDLRGVFLRGVCNTNASEIWSGRDPNSGTRKASGVNGTDVELHDGQGLWGGVGSFEGSAFSNHVHHISGIDTPGLGPHGISTDTQLDHTLPPGIDTDGSGTSTETRPDNVAVNYIIRAW